MIDISAPELAEELYWFVCGNVDRLRDFQEKAFTEGGLSIAEYVRDFCLADFEKLMSSRGYDLAHLPSGGSKLRSFEPEDSEKRKDNDNENLLE